MILDKVKLQYEQLPQDRQLNRLRNEKRRQEFIQETRLHTLATMGQTPRPKTKKPLFGFMKRK